MTEASIQNKSPLSTTPQERGKRLRLLRESLKLSRHAFGDRYEISPRSIQNWESARYGGLTEKGSRKIVSGLQKEGINCSLDWLYFGFGYGPSGLAIDNGLKISEPDQHSGNSISRELTYFHQLNPGSVDATVADSSLEPALLKGDYVAGKRHFEHEIAQAINHWCIVQTQDGKTLVRFLTPGEQKDYYNLACLKGDNDPSEYKNVRIFSAAPIVWIRRKFPA